MNLQQIEINALRPAEYNPRKMSPVQMENLKKGMQEFGNVGLIVVNKDMTVIGGHQRIKACRALGIATLPCVVLDITKEKEKALNLSLNRISGEWDAEALQQIIGELGTLDAFDMSLTGFEGKEVDEFIASIGKESKEEKAFDAAAEVEKIITPKTRVGDRYSLGKHRLVCGDIRSAVAVDALMQGSEADMVWTDPPYNVDYEGKTETRMRIQNDKLHAPDFRGLLLVMIGVMARTLKAGGCFYIAHAEGNEMSTFLRQGLTENPHLSMKQCIIWVKNSAVMGRQDYNWKHEPIIYGWKNGAAHYFNQNYTQTTVIDDDIDLGKLSKKELLLIVQQARDTMPSTVIREERPNRNALHPTQKPVELVVKNIYASSLRGQTVADYFGGGGSTLIAAEKTGRVARILDIDTRYCDVMVKRWEQFTGKEAILEAEVVHV